MIRQAVNFFSAAAALAIALGSLPAPALAAQRPKLPPCEDAGFDGVRDQDQIIADCTARIQSGSDKQQDLIHDYHVRGGAYIYKHQHDLAIADYTQVIHMFPHDENIKWYHMMLGFEYDQKGDYDSAISNFTRVIELHPSAQGYLDRSVAFFHKKDFDHAIVDITHVIAMDPKRDEAYSKRAAAFEQVKDYASEIADLDRVIELKPMNYFAFSARCWARMVLGQNLESALDDCDQAARLGPTIPGALRITRGAVELKLGKFAQAASDYDLALQTNSNSAEALYGRGLAKLKSGDPAGGDTDIGSAEAMQPNVAEVFAGYGIEMPAQAPSERAAAQQDYQDCQQTDDVNRGVAACTRIIDDKTESAANRALAYRWRGNDNIVDSALDEAISDYGEAVKLDPQNAGIYASRALALLRKGDRERASADYRRAEKLDPAKVAALAASSDELKELAKDLEEAASRAPREEQVASLPVAPAVPATVPAIPIPGAPGRSYWSHNGSTVYLVAKGAARELYYDKPRPGMLAAGAHPGSLLFRGTYAHGGFAGTAFIFNKHCGTLPYEVSGPVTNNSELITMHGEAPSADANCNITKHVSDTLEFALCEKSAAAGSNAPSCP